MRLSRVRYVSLVLNAAAMVGIAAGASVAWPRDQQLAPEGRGLLPAPTAAPGGIPLSHLFVSDPSGVFSRTLFETDDNPNFKLVIRDFSIPPDRQTHTVTLPSGAFLHLLDEPSEISIAKQRLALRAGARTAVPAGAPIDVVNNGERAVVVRVLIVEAK